MLFRSHEAEPGRVLPFFQIHAGEKGGEERQHSTRFRFVSSVAEAVEARRRAAEIDDHEESRGQRIEPEMGTQPRQADRQNQVRCRRFAEEERGHRDAQCNDRSDERSRIDQRARRGSTRACNRRRRGRDQRENAPQNDV